MTYAPSTALLNVDLQPGKPPILRAETPGEPARWSAEHCDALRSFVAEDGALLVRGLGLRDAAETEAVFRQLGSLMTEREGFAPRRCYAQGVYSSSKWPPNQPMCMHHELSYALELPSPHAVRMPRGADGRRRDAGGRCLDRARCPARRIGRTL